MFELLESVRDWVFPDRFIMTITTLWFIGIWWHFVCKEGSEGKIIRDDHGNPIASEHPQYGPRRTIARYSAIIMFVFTVLYAWAGFFPEHVVEHRSQLIHDIVNLREPVNTWVIAPADSLGGVDTEAVATFEEKQEVIFMANWRWLVVGLCIFALLRIAEGAITPEKRKNTSKLIQAGILAAIIIAMISPSTFAFVKEMMPDKDDSTSVTEMVVEDSVNTVKSVADDSVETKKSESKKAKKELKKENVIPNWLLYALVVVGFLGVGFAFRRKIKTKEEAKKLLSNWIVWTILLAVLIGGILISNWYKTWVFYECIFSLILITLAIMLWKNIKDNPRNMAPQESEESMVPHAFDPSEDNPNVSKEGEALSEYNDRRERTIGALREENESYCSFVSNQGLISLMLMTLLTVLFVFVNPLMILAFIIWTIYIVSMAFPWLKSNSEKKFFEEHDAWKIIAPLFLVFLLMSIVSIPLNTGNLWDILSFTCYAVLMVASYFIGCIYIVPIRRRWVFTIFNKVVKAEKLIIYTPNKDSILDTITGLHKKDDKKFLIEEMKDLNIGGLNWLDVGINIGVLSWLFVGVVDVISNYFMVVEATKQTRLLPTKGIDEKDRGDLGIKTKAAGTLSFFFRFFYLVGVDPLVSSRLSIGEREEAVPMAGRVMEGHLADRTKVLDFDKAMLYPFFDVDDKKTKEEESKDGVDDREKNKRLNKEQITLLSNLNRELLVLAGGYILKFNIIDRDPEEVIQKAMDMLTAMVYEVDQASVGAESTRIGMKAIGEGQADQVKELAKVLKNPENQKAMEMMIRMKGAEKASIHDILAHFSQPAS